MADEATQETAAAEAAENDSTAGESTAGGAAATEEVNWQERFEAQKKINRDLEQKVKGEAGTLRDQLAELQAKLDGKEKEYAETLKQREVEEAALAKANDRIRKAEVRAQAATLLADPADALRFLDLDQFEVGSDGEVDTAAVREAIEGLVKSKPYLAAQGGTTVFQSPGSSREGDAGKRQVTREELGRMTPEQINAARAEGRLNDLMGVKN